jgi:hypothetical protein
MTLSTRGHPDVLVVRGNEALRQHDLQGAERLYSEAARSEPHHAHALLRIACVRRLAGDDAGAARMVGEYAKTVAGTSAAGGRLEWKARTSCVRRTIPPLGVWWLGAGASRRGIALRGRGF